MSSRVTKAVCATVVLAVLSGGVNAQQLLVNPSVELPVATSPPGWTLLESFSDPENTSMVNTAQQVGFANQEEGGELGLWLRAFAGGTEGADAVLSQTAAAAPGESYTMTGWSLFQQNYSGSVDFLDFLSPSMGIASPTETLFELAFLDSEGAVLGSPTILDLKEEFVTFDWTQHMLTGVAPPETAHARVTASATEMLYNIEPMQSAFLDTFSLTADSAPGVELLQNANLETPPPTDPEGWVIDETENVGRYEGFAARTGDNGFWLAPRSAMVAPQDATFTQTVPGVAGGEYTLSGWSFFELLYPGGLDQLDSPEWGNIDSDTETYFTIEFLNDEGTVLDDELLDLRAVQSNDQTWRQHTLTGIAPEGTASVRVGVRGESLRSNDPDPTGAPFDDAYFDDFALTAELPSGVPGDYNEDGVVDAIDYAVWRDHLGAPEGTLPNDPNEDPIGAAQYATWRANYGTTAPSAIQDVSDPVPEPAAVLVLLFNITFALSARART